MKLASHLFSDAEALPLSQQLADLGKERGMNTDQPSTGQALQSAMILEVMGQLEDCLEREAASLIQPEVPDLVDIAAKKTRCFSALVPRDRALRAIAARAGAADGDQLLQHWLDAHGVTAVRWPNGCGRRWRPVSDSISAMVPSCWPGSARSRFSLRCSGSCRKTRSTPKKVPLAAGSAA